jgi:putative flippase GtrA
MEGLVPIRLPEGSIGAIRNMRIVILEAVGYTIVSACALCIDVAVLYVLVHYFFWWYLAAATFSFLAGLSAAYALSVTLVFRYRRLEDPRLEFASFAAIGIVGAAINAAAMALGVKYLALHYLVAKCGAAGFTFLWNFAARRQLLFVRRRSI